MPTIHITSDPADLIAAVPKVLGFHPLNSLVMVCTDGQHGLCSRTDLEPVSQWQEQADALVQACAIYSVRNVALVSYSEDGQDGDLMRVCFNELVRNGVVVSAHLKVRNDVQVSS